MVDHTMTRIALGASVLPIVVGVLVLYVVPSIVALARMHRNRPAIIALNLLAGWIFIGWVGSLVWALSKD